MGTHFIRASFPENSSRPAPAGLSIRILQALRGTRPRVSSKSSQSRLDAAPARKSQQVGAPGMTDCSHDERPSSDRRARGPATPYSLRKRGCSGGSGSGQAQAVFVVELVKVVRLRMSDVGESGCNLLQLLPDLSGVHVGGEGPPRTVRQSTCPTSAPSPSKGVDSNPPSSVGASLSTRSVRRRSALSLQQCAPTPTRTSHRSIRGRGRIP